MKDSMLDAKQMQLWSEYLIAEGQSPRAEKLHRLQAFIDVFVNVDKQTKAKWAFALAQRVVTESEDIPIRMPLFREILFPALLEGFQKNVPGCARWLAGWSHLLYNCRECLEQLPEHCRTDYGLLLAAIEHDPADMDSHRKLIEVQADYFRYSLHELPAGVLYGMDGASISECDVLQESLTSFRTLANKVGVQVHYQSLIEECEFHFREYKKYLLNQEQFTSYADYLEANLNVMAQREVERHRFWLATWWIM